MLTSVVAICSRCGSTKSMGVRDDWTFGQIREILKTAHRALPDLNWDGCQTEVPRGRWSLTFYDSPGPEIQRYVLTEEGRRVARSPSPEGE